MRDQLDKLWPLLEPAAARVGTFGKEYVWREIESGRSRLIATEDTALVFTVKPTPDGQRCLYCWLAGGKLDGVISLVSQAEEWAREQGCTLSAMDCRRGFGRTLPGYREISVTLMKEL